MNEWMTDWMSVGTSQWGMEINEFILFIIVNGYGAIEQRMSKILKFIHKTRSVSISLFE